MDDPRILYDLQEPVHGACERALFRAEHIGIDHEGQQRGDGQRPPLRHVDGSDVREREAHRNADRGVGDGFGIESLLALVEEECAGDDGGDERGGAAVERHVLRSRDLNAVVADRLARAEVYAQAHEERNECRAHQAPAYDRSGFEGLFGEEGGDVDRRDAQYDDGNAYDGGPQHEVEHIAVFVHIGEFQRQHGRDHGNGETACDAQRRAHIALHRFGLFAAYKEPDGEQDDDERDRRIQKHVHEHVFGERRPHIGVIVVRDLVVAFARLKVVLIEGQQGKGHLTLLLSVFGFGKTKQKTPMQNAWSVLKKSCLSSKHYLARFKWYHLSLLQHPRRIFDFCNQSIPRKTAKVN